MKRRFIVKTLLLSFIAFGLGIVYFLGFNFLLKKSQSNANMQAFINSELEKSQQTFNVKRQVDVIQEIDEKVSSYFLKSSEVPLFLNSIESIGQATGSNISISSVEETNLVDFGPVLSLSIYATGNYISVYKTLVFIENLPYLTKIDRASLYIDQSEDVGLVWNLKLNLLIKSYIK